MAFSPSILGRRTGRAAAGAAVGATLVLGTFAVAATAQEQSELPGTTRSAESFTDRREGVLGPDGKLAGYISADDIDQASVQGEPRLQIGDSEVVFRGFDVLDEQGKLAGYFLPGDNGFVSIDEVKNPESLAEIERVWLDDVADWQNPSKDVLRAQEELERQSREG